LNVTPPLNGAFVMILSNTTAEELAKTRMFCCACDVWRRESKYLETGDVL
jgi:hypothetical protein